MAIADIDIKKRLHQIADELPKNATLDDAMAKLSRLRELEAGHRDLEEGRVHSHEAVKRMIRPGVIPPRESDPEKRKQLLKSLVERMGANLIPEGAPRRFTRDELHERG